MLPYRLVSDSQYKGWKHLFYAPYNSRVRTLNRWAPVQNEDQIPSVNFSPPPCALSNGIPEQLYG